jgi:hypothetical protein
MIFRVEEGREATSAKEQDPVPSLPIRLGTVENRSISRCWRTFHVIEWTMDYDGSGEIYR